MLIIKGGFKRVTNDLVMDMNGNYYDMRETNMSFINVANRLRERGYNNYMDLLQIKNPFLVNIENVRDPSLAPDIKRQIFQECIDNIWYYLRYMARHQGEMLHIDIAIFYMIQIHGNGCQSSDDIRIIPSRGPMRRYGKELIQAHREFSEKIINIEKAEENKDGQ